MSLNVTLFSSGSLRWFCKTDDELLRTTHKTTFKTPWAHTKNTKRQMKRKSSISRSASPFQGASKRMSIFRRKLQRSIPPEKASVEIRDPRELHLVRCYVWKHTQWQHVLCVSECRYCKSRNWFTKTYKKSQHACSTFRTALQDPNKFFAPSTQLSTSNWNGSMRSQWSRWTFATHWWKCLVRRIV